VSGEAEAPGSARLRDLDRLFAETALAGVYLIQDDLFRYVNPAFARLFGYERDEIVDRLGPAALMLAHDHGFIEEVRRRLLERQEPSLQSEVRARTKSGATIEIEILVVAAPYRGRPAVLGTLLDISERKKMEREAADKRAEVEALYNAASRLVGAEDAESLAAEMVRALQEEFGRGYASVFLLDADGWALHLVACSRPEFLKSQQTFPLAGPGLMVLAAGTGEIVSVADVTRDPRFVAGPYRSGSELVLPLKVGERVLGVLNLESPEVGAFSGRDVVVLKAYADRAAAALDKAQLLERLAERTRQLERFHELALMMVGDPAAIYEAIVKQAAELLRVPYAGIVRIEGTLIRSLAVVSPDDDRAGATCPIDVTPCRVVRDARESRIFANVPQDFPDDPYMIPRGIRTYLGVPLFDRRGDVVGILDGMDRQERRFGSDDLRILGLLGRRAAEEMEEERRQLEERATERVLLHSEKLASLGQVVAGVAHELNNPLASVLGRAEILTRRADMPAPAREALAAIANEAERARRVVRNLLAFARDHEPERTATAINDVVVGTLALRESEMHLSNVEVVRELGTLPMTLADPHELQQALLNLVLNAEHAMIAAHGRGRLTVRTSSQPHGALLGGPALRVEVEDDGPGIPEETKRRIFEPFFTTKEVGKGTGLGLSLAHSIIGQHGGAIWAEDSPGGGARFVLELPVVAVPGPGAQPPSGAPGGPVALAGLRVLVADDEESLRDIAREVLEAEGCIVVEATDGRNALEQLESARFDLIVTDVKMPGLGGLDVYRQACERRPALRGRFLFVTGDWVSEDTARFFEETGCTHLEKPYNVDQLVEKARQVLAGSPSSS